QSQFGRDGHVAHHRPAHERHPATVSMGGVEYLLHSVDVTGETRHDDPLPRTRDDVVQYGSDVALRGHKTRDLGVGGVDAQQIDAFVAEPGEPRQVGEPAVERQLVELDVTRVQHEPGGGTQRDGERVGDRVVD